MRFTLAVALVLCVDCAAAVKQEFPRLGGSKSGSPQNYDVPAVQAKLAELDLIIVDFWPGWHSGGAGDAVRAIKELNPNILIVDYVNLGNVHNTAVVAAPLRAKLDAGSWWLYLSGTGGAKVPSKAGGPALSTTNHTRFAPMDAAGKRWNTWLANYQFNQVWSRIPEFDGTFTDSFYWRPSVTGDWNRDGKIDSPTDPAVGTWWREGMMAHVKQMKALMPGKLIMANLGRNGQPAAVQPEYQGQLHGGFLEHMIGQTWSPEVQSWNSMMQIYRKVMAMLAPPKALVFNVLGSPTDYKTFRYGFASALMDDAYFDYSDSAPGRKFAPDSNPRFDEYAQSPEGTRWLGKAIDPPQTTPWQKGVYRRKFENGMALVNPKGNKNQTVTVGPGYMRLKGTQAPNINNGGQAATVALADRDGLVLRLIDTLPPPPPSPTPPPLPPPPAPSYPPPAGVTIVP